MQSELHLVEGSGLGSAGAILERTYCPPFNLEEQYGRQAWNRKFIYNVFYLSINLLFFKGQSGFIGRALGGWTLRNHIAAGSGVPTQIGTTFFRLPGLWCMRWHRLR